MLYLKIQEIMPKDNLRGLIIDIIHKLKIDSYKKTSLILESLSKIN